MILSWLGILGQDIVHADLAVAGNIENVVGNAVDLLYVVSLVRTVDLLNLIDVEIVLAGVETTAIIDLRLVANLGLFQIDSRRNV